MIKKWGEKNKFEKTLDIISCVAFVVWFIFERLEGKTSSNYPEIAGFAAIFVVCVCEAISFWNQKRVISYIAIFGGAVLAAAIILEAFLVTA